MPALAEAFMDEEFEVIQGEKVYMLAANIAHLRIQGRLFSIINNYLKGKKCEVFFEAQVRFDAKNWFQPDITVVCDKDKIKATNITGTPDFVVEILSVTTRKRDFGIKKDTYEKFGVKEYWIIDPESRTVMVYLLKKNKYELDDVYYYQPLDDDFPFTENQLAQEKKAQEKALNLKLSLYDDLIIDVRDLFDY